MDILKGFIPLPGFGSDYLISCLLTTTQPNRSAGTWYDANFWEAQAALDFWGTPSLDVSESMSPLVDCVLCPRT